MIPKLQSIPRFHASVNSSYFSTLITILKGGEGVPLQHQWSLACSGKLQSILCDLESCSRLENLQLIWLNDCISSSHMIKTKISFCREDLCTFDWPPIRNRMWTPSQQGERITMLEVRIMCLLRKISRSGKRKYRVSHKVVQVNSARKIIFKQKQVLEL